MISILHTADWQIGRVFSQFEPDDAAALFEARFLAVERLASLATQHQVDAILVAGDVFEAQTVTEKTIRRLFNAMAGFTGPWVLIPGNHDAALTESVWTHAQRADLLKEAGKPTLLILDDALVHTDQERLGHMKRVLYDAATRHQILIFSCHAEAWRDLGVAARRLA